MLNNRIQKRENKGNYQKRIWILEIVRLFDASALVCWVFPIVNLSRINFLNVQKPTYKTFQFI